MMFYGYGNDFSGSVIVSWCFELVLSDFAVGVVGFDFGFDRCENFSLQLLGVFGVGSSHHCPGHKSSDTSIINGPFITDPWCKIHLFWNLNAIQFNHRLSFYQFTRKEPSHFVGNSPSLARSNAAKVNPTSLKAPRLRKDPRWSSMSMRLGKHRAR